MTSNAVSLLVHAAGSLVLGLLCCALYLSRQRAAFLYWTGAWAALTLWLLIGAAEEVGAWGSADRMGVATWQTDLGAIAAWFHGLLWVLGARAFTRSQAKEAAADAELGDATASPGASFRLLLHVVAFAVCLGVALATQHLAALRKIQEPLLLGFLGCVYGGSAWSFARLARRAPALGPVLLTAFMAATSLVCFLSLVLSGATLGSPSPALNASVPTLLTVADLVVQGLGAVALIVLLRDQEQVTLRTALSRLGESEEHFRMVFEHSGVGMALLSPTGQIIQVNPALTRMLGFATEDLQGRRLGELVHQEDVTHEGREAPPESSDLYLREKRYLHRDGHSVWARVVRVPVRDEAGRTRYHVGVLMDITDRKLAEQALAVSEERYRLRFAGAFDGIYLCTGLGELVDVNPAFCRMLGREREELVGFRLAALAEDPAELGRRLAAAQLRGDRFESRLLRKDREAIDVELSCAPLEAEGRALVHVSCRDVSERKQAEAALLRSEAERRRAEQTLREERDFSTQVLETADALIVVLDPTGRILRFNGKCAAVSGCTEEEVRGRLFWELLVAPQGAGPLEQLFRRLGTERVTTAFETTWLTRSGQERRIAWRTSRVEDRAGQIRYVIATGLDLTEQKRLEEQLRQSQKMEMLGTLVGGIAHDFNNQLTAILGNLHLLLSAESRTQEGAPVGEGVGGFQGQPASRSQDSLLSDAAQAAQRCADMTQQLLTFSRPRLGQPEPTRMNQVVTEAVRLLKRVLPATIQVETRLDPQARLVIADSTQLHQVVMNLAVNARDAMPHGGRLTLATVNRNLPPEEHTGPMDAGPGTFVELAVADTGLGMVPEVKARIFEPFFTTKPVGQGTGLGLAVVYGIVKAHGGWITVASEPGQGAVFRVGLPAASSEVGLRKGEPETNDQVTPVIPSMPTVAPLLPNSPKVILVVDDEDLIRNLLRAILERDGFRVRLAADGEEALGLYREYGKEIDLVVLDYTMPRLTGMEVFQELRQLNPSVRVIFSSGFANDQDSQQLLAAGAHGFVPKPYRPQDLLRVVREVLQSSP